MVGYDVFIAYGQRCACMFSLAKFLLFVISPLFWDAASVFLGLKGRGLWVHGVKFRLSSSGSRFMKVGVADLVTAQG